MSFLYHYLVPCMIVTLSAVNGFAAPSAEKKPEVEAKRADSVVKEGHVIERERKDILKNVSKYLNSIRTMKAEFTQTDAAGNIEYGTFTLRRPSQARWEYKAPSPLLLIANAGFLAIIDRELQEVRHVPADNSLSNILSEKNVDLTAMPDVSVDVPISSGEHLYVMLQKKSAAYDGTLTLHFLDKKDGLRLAGFVQLDAAGRTTEILFQRVTMNGSVDKKIFDVPEFKKRSRR